MVSWNMNCVIGRGCALPQRASEDRTGKDPKKANHIYPLGMTL